MNLRWYDVVGLVGVASGLFAYAALQLRWMRPTGLTFSLLNAVGAGLILLSLAFAFNLSAFAIEAAWLLISIFGLWRWRRRSREHAELLERRKARVDKQA